MHSRLADLVEALQQLLTAKKRTLAVAESITGGRIAAAVTARSGASDYFLGSLVTYADRAKKAVLGVAEQSLLEEGAVSETVAVEMLQGLFRATGADYGLSVTGVAGPAGAKPIGTVWCALGARGQPPVTHLFVCEGRWREEIMMETVERCLSALLVYVEKE